MARALLRSFSLLMLCVHHISTIPIEKLNTPKKSQEEIRASLITKHNFKEYLRQEKSSFNQKLPKPFVISTVLDVGPPSKIGSARQGRSFQDAEGNTVVEGIRVPDDESDTITHRNGRFINNIFVSNDALLPSEAIVSTEPKIQRQRQPRAYNNQWTAVHSGISEPRSGYPYPAFNYDDHYRGRNSPDLERLPDSIAVESRQQQFVLRPDGQPLSAPPPPPQKDSSWEESARDYNYHAGNTNSGRPVYYVVEEQDQLHEDRSPYTYEPADTHTSFTSAIADYTQAGTYNPNNDPLGAGPGAAANAGDFVIKEHTYTMCPGCPTFSIPIPIPKSTLIGSGSRPQPKQPPRRTGLPHYDKQPVNYQYSRNQTFLEKVGDRIWNRYQDVYGPVLKKAQEILPDVFDPFLDASQSFLGVEDDHNTIESKIYSIPLDDKEDKTAVEEDSEGFNFLPLLVGGVAAAALGVSAYLASTPEQINVDAKDSRRQGRLLNHKSYEEAGQVVELIKNAEDKYDSMTET